MQDGNEYNDILKEIECACRKSNGTMNDEKFKEYFLADPRLTDIQKLAGYGYLSYDPAYDVNFQMSKKGFGAYGGANAEW